MWHAFIWILNTKKMKKKGQGREKEEERKKGLVACSLPLLELALVKVVHLTCNRLCIATSLVH